MFTRSIPRINSTFYQNTFARSFPNPLKNYIRFFCTERQSNFTHEKKRTFTDNTFNKSSGFLGFLGGALLTGIGIYGYQKFQSNREILNSKICSIIQESSIVTMSPSFPPLNIVNLDKAREIADFESIYTKKNLNEIMGYEEQLNLIADYVRYLQNPEDFTQRGLAAPKGFILSGEPKR